MSSVEESRTEASTAKPYRSRRHRGPERDPAHPHRRADLGLPKEVRA
ncbi:hypothetical protein [Streptomyces avidinii]|uniref:Uncharacterized protein n=1 Tax=Streptomyces avidinii TaxID=1895 RepID=A0ABS4L2X7_STRAV|nr:hypothetical protein [Streptomyces avidinii]MBP2036631.1 hypothetical protein [Streptomyces avidinii]